MIYHCIYQNQCKNEGCIYRSTKKFLSLFKREDLRTIGFNCHEIKGRRMLLSSKERLVCSTNLKCDSMDCLPIRKYLTKANIQKFTRQKESEYTAFCPLFQKKIKLYTFDDHGKQTQTKYISIWD